MIINHRTLSNSVNHIAVEVLPQLCPERGPICINFPKGHGFFDDYVL
jgi:hypothetical protein